MNQDGDIVNALVERYGVDQEEEEELEEGDIEKVTIHNAIKALELLKLYEM